MADTLTLNGYDTSQADTGFTLVSPVGWQDAAARSFALAQRVGRPGAAVHSRRIETLDIMVTGFVTGSSNADAKTKLGNLKALLTQTVPATIIIGDFTARKATGELNGRVVVTPLDGMGNSAKKFRIDLPFTVADPPAFVETSATSVGGIHNSDAALAQGYARPHGMIIVIDGAWANPLTITYKDHDANTIFAMVFNVAGGASDFLVLDVDHRTVFLNTTGLPNDDTGGENAHQYLADPREWIDPDPTHWDTRTADWPTLRASSSSGPQANSECEYTKAY